MTVGTDHESAARVLLVYPPFGALSFPSIGLSLLKSTLERDGITCDVQYLNFDFLDELPGDLNTRLRVFDAISQRNEWCAGDWVFGECLFGPETGAALARSFREFLEAEGAGPQLIEDCFVARATAPRFLKRVMQTIPWERYRVVGFHSIFNQTVAGLAIARQLKERHPSIVTLFGGPGAQEDLGIEVLRRFTQIDFTVRGEADRMIVPLVRGLLAGTAVREIPGLVYRTSERGAPVVVANEIETIADMDSIPVPDFDDYFARLHGSGYETVLEVFLPIENSRGCWWGAKHHCTFCGIDDAAMAFRKKSPARALEDIEFLVKRYGVRSFRCVDNILDVSYFTTLLPRLADRRLDLRMFHELKANVKRAHLELLADAGITLLQPGLEHLSSEVLRLMRKGTTFLQNVQFLKWARERRITVFWSILYGFPGERWESYAGIPERMAALHHLFPPKGAVRARVDRFSPLFTSPGALGLTRLRPTPAYRHVYPFDEEVVSRLAYHFEGDYADRDPELNDRIAAWLGGPIKEWNDCYFRDGASLDSFAGLKRLLVRDTRDGRATRWVTLEGATREIYLACDSIRTGAELETAFARCLSGADAGVPPFQTAADEIAIDLLLHLAHGDAIVRYPAPERLEDLGPVLERLIADRLMVAEDGRYLALACRATSLEALLAPRAALDRDMLNMAATRNIRFEGVEGLVVGSRGSRSEEPVVETPVEE